MTQDFAHRHRSNIVKQPLLTLALERSRWISTILLITLSAHSTRETKIVGFPYFAP